MLKGLAALAAVAVLILAGRTFMDSSVPSQVHPQVAAKAPQDLMPATAERLENVAPELSLAFKQRRAIPALTEALKPPNRVATLTGSVVVHELDGEIVTTTATGALEASIRFDRTGRGGIVIEVHDGRFSFSITQGDDGVWIPPGQSAEQMKFTAGAAVADLELEIKGGKAEGLGTLVMMESPTSSNVARERGVFFSEEGTVLHVRTVPPLTLNVLDAGDRTVHLEDIEALVAAGQSDRCLIGAASPRPTLASAQDSPIVLMPGVDQARGPTLLCFVRAPGFAWNSVEVDLSSGGERTIALERGGGMEVLVQGEAPREARLRIYREGERPAISDLKFQRNESFQLQGLPLGPMSIRIEIGSVYRPTMILAEADVVIQAGSRASVLLIPKRLETPGTARVTGELRVPAGWELDDALLIFRRVSPSTGSENEREAFRLSELSPMEGQPERHPFTVEALVPGDYVATLTELEYKTYVSVPAAGLSDLRIEIPAPVKVTVTVRDTVTGEISDLVQRLTWQQHYEGPRTGGVVPGVQRNEITRQFNLSVPAGPISVSVGGRQVAHSSLIIDAVDGLNIELEAERVALAYVELQHEGRTIPWPDEFLWDASCVHRDGDGEVKMRGATRTGAIFNVTEPGRYRLTLPEVEGFERHEPIEIDMDVDEVQKIVVELLSL